MAEAKKRFYWLKLKDDFFDEKYVKALRRLPQGDSLVIVYLKMQLKSLKTEGILKYEGIMPDCISELAMALDEDENVTRFTVEALIRFGVMERWDNDTLYLLEMQKLIGTEGASAERVRKHREAKALQSNTPSLQGNSDETKSNTEIEIEKEIDIEKRERDRAREKKGDIPASAGAPAKPTRHKYGQYNNVLLSDEDMAKLQAEFPGDWQERIERLSSYMASKGATYKNHLATIRNWARNDKKKAAGQQYKPVDRLQQAYDPSKYSQREKTYDEMTPEEKAFYDQYGYEMPF